MASDDLRPPDSDVEQAPGADRAAEDEPPPGPLTALGILAGSEVAVTDQLDHIELYTREGLLSLLWHGRADHESVVLMAGGALGGMLGPGKGLYHSLGVELAELGIGSIRVGYRAPNDLDRCVHDTMAAADLAARQGARRFIVLGHSFGGAVAIQTGLALGQLAAGVVTFATQLAGAEGAGELACPLLLFHGDQDEVLPSMTSKRLHMVTGAELVMSAGAGHLLTEAHDEIHGRLISWIPEQLDRHEL